jgi:AcrR family transcriptional regulator
LRIIVRDGPSAITLRSVVAEAGATHGSVAYYFGSREELIRAALEDVAARNIDALSAAWSEIDEHAGDPVQVARLIAKHSTERMIRDREMGITIVELHLAAGRDAGLRPALRRWGRAYAAISRRTLAALGSADPDADAATLTNAITGMVIGQLAVPRSDFETAALRPFLERFLRGIAGA